MRTFLRCWVVLFLSAAITVYSAPLNLPQKNETQKIPVENWQPDPKGRGTFQIIFSCIVTLFLCVWTTVHVNIEPIVQIKVKKDDSKSWKLLCQLDVLLAKRFIRKIGWSITSLFLPELTMTVAAYERKTARLLRKEMRKLRGKRTASSKNNEATDASPDSNKNEVADTSTGPNKNEVQETSIVSTKGAADTPTDSKKNEPTDTSTDSKNEIAGVSSDPKNEAALADAPTNSNKNEKEEASTDQDDDAPNCWEDLSLCYYAVMGGFRVIYRKPGATDTLRPGTHPAGVGLLTGIVQGRKKDSYIWEKQDTPIGTLTPHGVLFMAKCGWLPDIGPEIVKDKSKVNALAKVLVCFQAAWIIVQVIARTAFGKSVTLLEVHTVLQTLCAATMYITWWDKPADIDLPTEINLSEDQFQVLYKAERGPETENPTNPFTKPSSGPDLKYRKDAKYVTSRAGLGKLMYQQLCVEVENKDKTSPSEGESPDKNDGGLQYLMRIVVWYFDTLGRAFTRMIRAKRNIWKQGLFLCAVGLIYGGAHLSTWNNLFPNLVEQWMWRICSIITAVALCGFVFQLIFGALIWGDKKDELGAKKTNTWDKYLWRLYRGFVGITFGLGIFIVLVARLFLVVESFIALRKVPKDSYESIPWADMWPHLG